MGSKTRMFSRCLIVLSVLLLSVFCKPFVCAESYYADVTVDVDRSGFVSIDGTTNYPGLLVENTQNYTSKNQSYWVLNITKNVVFTDFVVSISLPQDSSINYVKTSGFFGIEQNDGRLLVNVFGENDNLSLVIQYQIDTPQDAFGSDDTWLNWFLFAVILLLVGLFIVVYFKYPDERLSEKDQSVSGSDDASLKGLNSRQKRIMRLLQESAVPLTQTDIQKELGIPKASVSRNIRRLELKGLIEKEKMGMSNIIRLKKD